MSRRASLSAMTAYVTDFKHYPRWWAAWCLECKRNVFVHPDRFTVQEKAFEHDDEHHPVPDAFDAPEFVDSLGDGLDEVRGLG